MTVEQHKSSKNTKATAQRIRSNIKTYGRFLYYAELHTAYCAYFYLVPSLEAKNTF